jgi:hypothetical protein
MAERCSCRCHIPRRPGDSCTHILWNGNSVATPTSAVSDRYGGGLADLESFFIAAPFMPATDQSQRILCIQNRKSRRARCSSVEVDSFVDIDAEKRPRHFLPTLSCDPPMLATSPPFPWRPALNTAHSLPWAANRTNHHYAGDCRSHTGLANEFIVTKRRA